MEWKGKLLDTYRMAENYYFLNSGIQLFQMRGHMHMFEQTLKDGTSGSRTVQNGLSGPKNAKK